MIAIAQETLNFRCAGFSPALWLLMPTFSLLCAPRWVTPYASVHKERSPTDRSRLATLDVHEQISTDYLRIFTDHRFYLSVIRVYLFFIRAYQFVCVECNETQTIPYLRYYA